MSFFYLSNLLVLLAMAYARQWYLHLLQLLRGGYSPAREFQNKDNKIRKEEVNMKFINLLKMLIKSTAICTRKCQWWIILG